MFNRKLKDQVTVLQVQVADLNTQVSRLTTAIQNIHKRKQAQTKVNDSMKLTPSAEELATKGELRMLRKVSL